MRLPLLGRIRALLRDPIYRRERRHGFFGKRWLGPAARATVVGAAYAAFITVWITGGDDWGEGLRLAGTYIAGAIAAIAVYAAPGLVGAAVAAEFDDYTADSLFLTPLSRNHIVFAKLFARLTGLFELYVWVLPIFLLTPKPELIGGLTGFDIAEIVPFLPSLETARMPAEPYSVWSVLIGLKDWLQGLTAVYYSGAVGMAAAMFARSGKLAIVLSYVGMLFIAGTIMGIPILLVMGGGTVGTIWLAMKGYKALGILLHLACSVIFMQILFSIVIPTIALRLCARRIDAHLDAGQ